MFDHHRPTLLAVIPEMFGTYVVNDDKRNAGDERLIMLLASRADN